MLEEFTLWEQTHLSRTGPEARRQDRFGSQCDLDAATRNNQGQLSWGESGKAFLARGLAGEKV